MATIKSAAKGTGTNTAKGNKPATITPKTVKAAKTEKPIKEIPAQTAQNKVEVKKEITDKKDLMYIYPKGCTELGKRKKFRHQVRAHNEQFEKAITKLAEGTDKKALKAKEEEYAEYRKSVMVKP